MFPEWVWARCVDQAVRIVNGEAVKPHGVVPTIPIARDTLEKYFVKSGDTWMPDFPDVGAISANVQCPKT
jgi:hypothetical protein